MADAHIDNVRQLSGQPPEYGGTQTGGPVTLTVAEAARQLGVSERTVRRRAIKANLPPGWEVLADRTPLTILVADSRTLRNMTGRVPDVSGQMAVTSIAEFGRLQQENEELRHNSREAQEQISVLNATVESIRAALAASEEHEQWLRNRVEVAEAEKQRLMDLIPKALPPAPSFMQRLQFWRRSEGGE